MDLKSKIERNIIEISNLVLYHGTAMSQFLRWIRYDLSTKFVYFSTDEKQSEYHPLTNDDRYFESTLDIPVVYKFQLKKNRKLRLLNIRIEKNDNDEYYHVFANTNDPLPIDSIISYSKGECINTLKECNKYILNWIEDIQKLYNLKRIDGYVCFNDQSEVALILPESNNPLYPFISLIELKVFNVIKTEYDSFEDEWSIDRDESHGSIIDDYLNKSIDERKKMIEREVNDFIGEGYILYNFMMYTDNPKLKIIYTPYVPSEENVEEQIINIIKYELV